MRSPSTPAQSSKKRELSSPLEISEIKKSRAEINR